MKLDLTDVYKILANVTERNNDKLKTFAALKFTEEFNDVALNKGSFYRNGVNDGIFYSKAWSDDSYNVNKISIDYPALIGFSNTAAVGVAFSPRYVLDLYTVDIDTKQSKAWELKMTDLDTYLVTILRDLQKYVYITSNEVSGWYFSDVVDSNEASGVWTDVVRDGWLKERLKTRNINFTRGFADTPKNLLTLGTQIEIQGCI